MRKGTPYIEHQQNENPVSVVHYPYHNGALPHQVRRTAERPLASGRITHRQALGFLALQLSAGLGVLLQFDPTSIALGAASLGLVVAYPLMKRVTHYPQAVLGMLVRREGNRCVGVVE